MCSSVSKGAARRALPSPKWERWGLARKGLLHKHCNCGGRNVFPLSQTSKLPDTVTLKISLLLERAADRKVSNVLLLWASLASYKRVSPQSENGIFTLVWLFWNFHWELQIPQGAFSKTLSFHTHWVSSPTTALLCMWSTASPALKVSPLVFCPLQPSRHLSAHCTNSQACRAPGDLLPNPEGKSREL